MLHAEDIVEMAKDAARWRWIAAHVFEAGIILDLAYDNEDLVELVDAAMEKNK